MADPKSSPPIPFGRNVEYTFDGEYIVIRMKFATRTGPSSTGKTIGIASSGGNQNVMLPNGVACKIGVNAYVDVPRADWSDETLAADDAARAARGQNPRR